MQDFPANSAKAKRAEEPKTEERPTVERVTTAEPGRRKRGLGRKFKETFVGGSAKMAVEYMVVDVVIPEVQNMLIEALQGGIERLIKGESRPKTRAPTGYSNLGRFDYSGISRPTTASRQSSRMLSRESRTRQTFDEIVIPSRGEAEEVLDRMYDILSREQTVLVADLYALTGIQSSHTDHRWGWANLRGARVTRLRSGGFLLDLPEPEAL